MRPGGNGKENVDVTVTIGPDASAIAIFDQNMNLLFGDITNIV